MPREQARMMKLFYKLKNGFIKFWIFLCVFLYSERVATVCDEGLHIPTDWKIIKFIAWEDIDKIEKYKWPMDTVYCVRMKQQTNKGKSKYKFNSVDNTNLFFNLIKQKNILLEDDDTRLKLHIPQARIDELNREAQVRDKLYQDSARANSNTGDSIPK